MNMEIQLTKVSAGRKQILKPMELKVKQGTVTVVLGRNGSGKSTLINAITAHPDYKLEGDVGMQEPIFVGFQRPVEIPELLTERFLIYLDNQFGLKSETPEELWHNYKDLFNRLEIAEEMLKQPLNRNLSGGENKRLELVQMAIIKPKTVLLDEIDTGLDLDMLVTIGDFLSDYHKQYKPTMLVVTHNLTFL